MKFVNANLVAIGDVFGYLMGTEIVFFHVVESPNSAPSKIEYVWAKRLGEFSPNGYEVRSYKFSPETKVLV